MRALIPWCPALNFGHDHSIDCLSETNRALQPEILLPAGFGCNICVSVHSTCLNYVFVGFDLLSFRENAR